MAARALGVVTGVGVLVCAWLTIGPAQLGGPVTYAIVSGSSMEPHLHRGDLVVVRPAARYQVGDVVAYRTAQGATILHRIIGTAGNRFVVRGDANTWTDPYEPARQHIVGRLDHRIPVVGRILDWLRSPLPMSLTVGVVAFFVGARYTRRGSAMKRSAAAVAVAVGLAVPVPALAAGVSVPTTRLSRTVLSIGPNDLKPTACGSITVTKLLVVTGTGGTVTGTSAAELILGGPNASTLKGAGGNDCLVGGGGNDTLNGGAGTDVCIGGPGSNTYDPSCETKV